MRGSVWGLVPAGRCRQLLLVALSLSSISAVFALVPALVIALIAAVLFDRIDLKLSVMQLVFVALASVMARLGFLLLARNTAGSATELLTSSLRADAATKIGALALGDLAQSRPASFESLLLDDVETIGQYVSERLVDIAGAYAMLSIALAIVFARDWRLASLVLAVTLAFWSALRVRGARLSVPSEDVRLARANLAAAVFGSIRSLGLETSLPARDGVGPLLSLAAAYRRAAHIGLASAAARNVRRRALAAALPAATVLCAVALGAGRLDFPGLILVAALTLRTSGALAYVFTADVTTAPAGRSVRRVRELLARPSMPEGTTQPTCDGTLRFSGVSFAYPAAAGGRTSVLRDVSFAAETGRVTAIVGPSGSGKTTLTRLAARFWDADDGHVEVGGVDVRMLPVDALMRQIACIFQDVALLNDTVAANLRLGRPDASDDDMIAAAQAAGAHAFVSALPRGYETLVGDRGLYLSRGERQRLQIARALLKDAPIVILDEPTASLDPATEAEIGDALVPLLRGKTVLVVAHRLATIVDADRIVVLGAEGTVEAQGTHAALLRESATYAHLWKRYRSSIDWSDAERMAVG